MILTYVPYIEQPSISLGPITIHASGVIVAAAVPVGLKIGERRFGTLGLNRELGERMAWWAIVGGFLGAHLFSVIFYFPRELAQNPLPLFFPFSLMISRIACSLADDHPGTIKSFPPAISLTRPRAQQYIARSKAQHGS